MENITKRLIEEFGVKKEIIALRLKASIRSVERWHNDGVPFHFYQVQLERMLEKEMGKRA